MLWNVEKSDAGYRVVRKSGNLVTTLETQEEADAYIERLEAAVMGKKMPPKKMPMDKEDMKDGGSDENTEKDDGDAEDKKDGGADEDTEDKNGKKKKAEKALDKTPYGDVTYADPGYQADKKKRYPIDSAEHCRAAWSYINQAGNASEYSPEQVASIKSKIKSAAKKFGIDISG